MNTKEEKIELAKRLLAVSDPQVIQQVKRILDEQSSDFWNDLSEDQKEEIEQGIEDIKKGAFSDYDSFISAQL